MYWKVADGTARTGKTRSIVGTTEAERASCPAVVQVANGPSCGGLVNRFSSNAYCHWLLLHDL